MLFFLGKPGGREQGWSLGLILPALTLPIFFTFCSSLECSNTFCSPAVFLGQEENRGLESRANKFSKQKVDRDGGKWRGEMAAPIGAGRGQKTSSELEPHCCCSLLLMETSSFYPLQQLSGHSMSLSTKLPCKWGASTLITCFYFISY